MRLQILVILTMLSGIALAQSEIYKYEIIGRHQGYQPPFVMGLHLSENQNNPAATVPQGLEFSIGWRYGSGTDSTALSALDTKRYQPYLPQYARLSYGRERVFLQAGYRQVYNLHMSFSRLDFSRKIFIPRYFISAAYELNMRNNKLYAGLGVNCFQLITHEDFFVEQEGVNTVGLGPMLGLCYQTEIMQLSFFYDGGLLLSETIKSPPSSDNYIEFRSTIPHRYVADALFHLHPSMSVTVGLTLFDWSRQNIKREGIHLTSPYLTNRPHWRSSMLYQWSDNLSTSIGLSSENYTINRGDTYLRTYIIGGIRATVPYADWHLQWADSRLFNDDRYRDYYVQLGFALKIL